jgi:hypothetical protein
MIPQATAFSQSSNSGGNGEFSSFVRRIPASAPVAPAQESGAQFTMRPGRPEGTATSQVRTNSGGASALGSSSAGAASTTTEARGSGDTNTVQRGQSSATEGREVFTGSSIDGSIPTIDENSGENDIFVTVESSADAGDGITATTITQNDGSQEGNASPARVLGIAEATIGERTATEALVDDPSGDVGASFTESAAEAGPRNFSRSSAIESLEALASTEATAFEGATAPVVSTADAESGTEEADTLVSSTAQSVAVP